MGEDLQMKCLLELYGLKVTAKPYHLSVILSVINCFSFKKKVMSLIFIHSIMHSCPRLSPNCCLMCILCFSSVTFHGKKLVYSTYYVILLFLLFYIFTPYSALLMNKFRNLILTLILYDGGFFSYLLEFACALTIKEPINHYFSMNE